MAKDLEMGYLLDFYGEVLTQKQREMLRQYYNDDLSLSEIGENFGITRQGAQLWQVEMGAYSTLPADLPAIHMGESPLVDQPLTVEGKVWKVTCISVGNPHCVTVVEDVDSLKLEAIGPSFEHHANFPERINTEFVQVVDSTHLKMRVWERGSGEIMASGTGACAAAPTTAGNPNQCNGKQTSRCTRSECTTTYLNKNSI